MAIPNGANLSGFGTDILTIPTDELDTRLFPICVSIMLSEKDRVTHSCPFLSNVNKVGPLFSPEKYSTIFLDCMSYRAMLFPVISVIHKLFPSGDKTIPIGPEFFVGTCQSWTCPFATSSLP